MVSQPTMRFIFAPRTCLAGLTAILLLFAACGQNEGGRCQIDSDCGSGLRCNQGMTGNGLCVSSSTVVANTDARSDLADDEKAAATSDVGTEAAVMSTLDAEPVDAGSLDVPVDADSLDTGSVD